MPLNLGGQGRTTRRSRLGLGGQPRDDFDSLETTPLDDDVAVEPDEGIDPRMAAAGAAAGIGGIALLARAPGRLGKLATLLNSARQQLMLSGLAIPKSVAGNVGAGVEASLESKSLRPLKELFSRQTMRDAGAAWRRGGISEGTPGVDQGVGRFGPGRVMGALDEATQGALRRSGYSAEDAAARVLQAPLPERLAKVLNNPGARYLQPFRRTPFNQFFEGIERVPLSDYSWKHPLMTYGYTGAGAAHGALRSEAEFPADIGMGVAASSRHGMNYALGAAIGRLLAEGNMNLDSAVGNVLPVSEYGFESAVTDPLRPFRRPALWSLLGEEDLF